MYQRFMTLIENHSDKITKNVVQEVQKREETRHYWDLSEDVREERIAQVICNVHVRLGNWLNKNKPKNTLVRLLFRFRCSSVQRRHASG